MLPALTNPCQAQKGLQMAPSLAPASHLPDRWVHPSPWSLPEGQPEGH